MNTITDIDIADEEYISLFPPGAVDCHTWCPLFHAALGLYLDFCAVCGEPHSEHPPDSFPDNAD